VSRSADRSVSVPWAKPLTVGVVREVFAFEGVPLRRLRRWRDLASRRPVSFVPGDASHGAVLWVTVYGRDAVERSLGLYMTNEGFETIRVRNVLISFAPNSAVVGRVSAAVARLREMD
jgi:hypothetical protein